MVLAWLAGTLMSVLIATAAVGAVRGRVTDDPPALDSAASTAAASSTIETTAPNLPTSPGATPGSVADSSPSTTLANGATSVTSGTSGTSGTSATSTTGPSSGSSTSSTTAPPAQGVLKTFRLVGGTVTIEVFSDHLMLVGAQPKSGFTVSEKDNTSTRIEIEFSSSNHESKLRAELKDGELDARIDEEGDEDGDHD